MKLKGSDITAYIVTLFLLAGTGTVLFLDNRDEARRNCRSIEISAETAGRFVEDEEVKQFIRDGYGECVGQRINKIDLGAIEHILDNSGAILKSQVWTSSDAVLHVCLSERTPIVRFQKDGDCFYADAQGCLFELHHNCDLSIPIIDGDFPVNFREDYKGEAQSLEERQWLSQALDMIKAMEGTPWKENITQISVQPKGDIVMVPREGSELFVFGSPAGAADKFERMGRYYTHILPEKGKDYYSRVSVKYKGQIICTK